MVAVNRKQGPSTRVVAVVGGQRELSLESWECNSELALGKIRQNKAKQNKTLELIGKL